MIVDTTLGFISQFTKSNVIEHLRVIIFIMFALQWYELCIIHPSFTTSKKVSGLMCFQPEGCLMVSTEELRHKLSSISHIDFIYGGCSFLISKGFLLGVLSQKDLLCLNSQHDHLSFHIFSIQLIMSQSPYSELFLWFSLSFPILIKLKSNLLFCIKIDNKIDVKYQYFNPIYWEQALLNRAQ